MSRTSRQLDGIRTIVIRPSMIYGDGGSEQLPLLIRHAVSSRESIYAGEGLNRRANVFLGDLANVYAFALQAAPAGRVYNIASGELEMRAIGEGIGQLVGVPTRSVPSTEAHAALGERWVDVALASNSRVYLSLAQSDLGWVPVGPPLLDDLLRVILPQAVGGQGRSARSHCHFVVTGVSHHR